MRNAKEKSDIRFKDKVWDRVFKTILQEQPALFIPLINMVFEKQYKRDVSITSISTESYNKDKGKIMSDIAFLIEDISYHFECQYLNDDTMAFRMFEYDFHITLIDSKRGNNFAEFNFPRSCVFYIEPKDNIPKKLKMKINFQNGSFDYEVPIIRLYDYDLDKMEQEELFLFLPYEILRHIRNVTTEKHIIEYANEINFVYSKIIYILKNAYNNRRLKDDELLTLMNMLSNTAEYKLKNYPQIWKEVSEMLNQEYVPRWKIELEQAKKETAKEVKKQVTKEVTKQVTKQVTEEVTKTTEIAMLKLMKENGIPEKQIREIAKQKKISVKTVDDILNSSETKKMVQV